ncbi:MAG TPA: hypothetical protein DDW94_02345 [Deltaproteobacteria bacterium]|nr:MAG: hypothetical protein A2Z79_09495 [Deltaproteobacteria bacterium GWA2_55_82]OGQ65021.1 MAG: hypothetical protein A3I81_02130 [Deltaproteobacteria bacterium RIFCSPLOWO2_02_FULL_55_12]OIJ73791.1 MAG: hypothetical protein A2V21_305635 [Deltaproteobacteria bacterium GWC2_55_46]HBG45806.1 hypothetical protein [Deltaproteobacteria bacterium]HCY09775.1 hypothetical protein [Deltaproteobacteria bacterium]
MLHPAKKILLLAALAFLFASCARERFLEAPEEDKKEERPLWWVLQHKETASKELSYEDRWYRYEAEFDYIQPGMDIYMNPLMSLCPIEKATYKVTDKETGEVVRAQTLFQIPCDTCHKR